VVRGVYLVAVVVVIGGYSSYVVQHDKTIVVAGVMMCLCCVM
jgi:hypothetical protein